MAKFAFDEEYLQVPAQAVDADPVKQMRDLFYRISLADAGLEEVQLERNTDVQEVLLQLIDISDQIMQVLEKAGLPQGQGEAKLVAAMVDFGAQVRNVLDGHQVEAINTIGMPFDPDTSVVADSEEHASLAPNTVMREERIGYSWPAGVLRRASVVVSRAVGVDEEEPPLMGEDTDAHGGHYAG